MLTVGGGDIVVEILPEVGGRMHRLQAFGVDLLRTPPDPAVHAREPFTWGAYPMVPWCNRIPGGRFTFDGRDYELPVNFADGSAIHGEAYAAPWTVTGDGSLRFDGGGAYPWPYHASMHVSVADSTVTLDLTVSNDHDAAVPLGIGWHPWWDARDGLAVSLPAHLVYRTEATLPVGDPVPVIGDYDLRELRPPPWGLDTTWTGLTEQRVTLHWAQSGITATVNFSSTADHVVVAAFEAMHAVAVEPQTHAPDGPGRLARNQPGAMTVVDAGAAIALHCIISFSAR